MALSHRQVFNDYITPLTMETLAQRTALFNRSSNGAIQLTGGTFTGDFMQESFFTALGSAQRRVDRYAVNAAAPVIDLAEAKLAGVKVAGGIGPVRMEPAQMTWLSNPTSAGIEQASRHFADIILSDQINTAIATLVAAIANQAEAAQTSTAVNYVELNKAHAKFGDASNNIVADVMTGSTYHELIGVNLNNPATLFTAGNVTIVSILGKTVIVTDAPALAAGGKQRVLGLSSGAALVYDGSEPIFNTDTTNGKQRIETTLQCDYDFGLSLKGYAWNDAVGGKSPDNTKLETGINWIKKATSIKHTAGVILVAG